MTDIINIIYEELKESNATLDTIKSYVRVAILTNHSFFKNTDVSYITKEEGIEMVKRLCEMIPFMA